MQTPLVSIIIPTFNRAHLIDETIDSVLAQTYTNWECIVVDDGSTDSTNELMQRYCEQDNRIQYHHRPNNHPKGANACRNYGFELSKGDYVNWFDDDDVMLPDFIKVKMDFISSEIHLIICSGYYANEELTKFDRINLNEETFLFKDYVLWNIKILTPSLLIKRSFLKGKDLFSNKIKRGQEAEFFSRLFYKLERNNYILINKPFFYYRQHQISKSYRNKSYLREYSESNVFINFENLKRSLELNDKILINNLVSHLLVRFFISIQSRDFNHSIDIYKNLEFYLKKINFKLYLKFKILGIIILTSKRPINYFEYIIKNSKII